MKYLSPPDLLILTVILFGPALVSSAQAARQLADPAAFGQEAEFSRWENLYALLSQAVQLALALGYLYWRRFDFSVLEIAVTWKGAAFALLLFCLLGAVTDLFTILQSGFGWVPELLRNRVPILSALKETDLPLVLISLLNGFYEEFFFLGLCTAVDPRYSWAALAWGVLIRILIHTYQGAFTAITMGGSMGILYYLLFAQGSRSLFPYSLAHALADLFGMSLLNLL